MNRFAAVFACALSAGVVAAPARSSEPRIGKADAAVAGNRAAHAADETPMVASQRTVGKAGIDRFVMRNENIRESVRADGTVIIELNGEGMEKMMLDETASPPNVVCASTVERAAAGAVPADLRGAVRARGGRRETR